MKKTFFMIVLLMGSRLLAIAPLGPAAGNLKKGDSSLGIEYARAEADYTVKVLGLSDDYEAQCDGFYGKYVYGIADGSELFVRFGGAKFSSDTDVTLPAGYDFATSAPGYDFAWGIGAKTTLAKSANVRWGIAAQVTWWQAQGDVTSADYDLHEVDKGYSVQVAGGPVFDFDALSIYGGPVLFLTKAEGRCTGRVADTIVKVNGDIEQDLQLGGYVGLSLELAKTVDFNVEYQLSADTAVLGIGLTYRF